MGSKTTLDPLLAALIAKLPASGSNWAVEQQAAWLRMVAMAFGVVYGGDVAALELPAFLGRPAAPQRTEEATPVAAPSPPKPATAKHAFYIDLQGVARNGAGDEIMPSQVHGVLHDMRGELGDLGTITWADGSRGVAGLQLDISAGG